MMQRGRIVILGDVGINLGDSMYDGEGIIALGDYTILPGDRIVVCCLPRSIKRIESLFL